MPSRRSSTRNSWSADRSVQSISGCVRKKRASAGPTSPPASDPRAPSLTRPRSPDCAIRAASTPSRSTSSTRRAYGRKPSPIGVSETRRPRVKRMPPTSSSSAWMRELTAGCPMPSVTAARLKLPSRTTFSKAAIWSRSMAGAHPIETIDGSYCGIELKHGCRAATVPSMIRLATSADAEAIAAIYRPIVAATAISFETVAPGPAEMERRIAATLEIAPWLVYEDEEGRVAGYAYGSRHRERAAYQWSVDASVYVGESSRRRGIGRALYDALFPLLRLQGFYAAHAGITLPNAASVALHESLGFRPVGIYPGVGYKLGGWHDVGWWQLELRDRAGEPSPPKPLDEMQSDPRWAEELGR